VQDLNAGTAQTFSLNHAHQTPAYGYGLLTSISSAVLGLRLAESDHVFSQGEKYISQALLLGANHLTRSTDPPLNYKFAIRPTVNDSAACLTVELPDASHFQWLLAWMKAYQPVAQS
jgi:hypothetical protein